VSIFCQNISNNGKDEGKKKAILTKFEIQKSIIKAVLECQVFQKGKGSILF